MQIKQITWQQALPIRHCVLWPQQPLQFCKVVGDETATHFGGFLNDELVCVASVYSQGNVARLRKFATLANFQGRGVGSAVITHVIAHLKQANINYFWCDARTTASSFYEQFGMDVEGPVFDKSGVKYCKMSVSW